MCSCIRRQVFPFQQQKLSVAQSYDDAPVKSIELTWFQVIIDQSLRITLSKVITW